MNPLERKKELKEMFNKNKKRRELQQKEILSFREFEIKVNTDLLCKYRKERGGADY